ncbi:MAG: hypothetical protein HY043_11365 [Verrucomicrobia bacterium]|nr:hypothetical protein [Verrucomicrobiota bacterium]
MNRVCIEPTKFTDLRSGGESFGWRAFDDYSQAYDGSWSKADMPEDDVVFLKRVLATSEDKALWAMVDFCSDFRQGIHVGDNFVDWPELSPLLGFVRA